MVRVIRNTYPKHPGVGHAEPGDICRWELSRGYYRLVRISDGVVVFGSAPVNKDGLKSNGKPPVLVGVVAQIKSKGWVLEVEEVKDEHPI